MPVEEIIASLFEAVVYQNLATLTKGNTPRPEVLLLGGPNLFFPGLREAWAHHLGELWSERSVAGPGDRRVEDLIVVPEDALYYAASAASSSGGRGRGGGVYAGTERLRWWIEEGQHEEKAKHGRRGLWSQPEELARFKASYDRRRRRSTLPRGTRGRRLRLRHDHGQGGVPDSGGRDRSLVLRLEQGQSDRGRQGPVPQGAGDHRGRRVAALALTGYGKDLLRDILGADCAVVETVAHATAALHFFPDAD